MYSISLEKAEPRSEEGVHKEGEETVIKLVDKEDLRKEREEKLALEEKKAGGQGCWFEPGWKQTYFSSFVSLPFVADVYDTH